MKTMITGRYVVGFDGKDHVLIENGQVVYEGDSILYVGKRYDGEYDERIDAGKAIVSPGFIDLDALGDIDHALIFGEVDPALRRHLWWSDEYFPNRKEWMSVEDEAFKSLYAYSHLLLNGITTAMPITCVFYKKAAETYEEAVAAAHNAGRLGIRIYLGPSYISAMQVVDKDGTIHIQHMGGDGREGLERAKRFAETFHGAYDGLINAVMVPERIELQTEEILTETKSFAREIDCPVRLHAAQGEFEYRTILSKYGMGAIPYLDSIGFLDHRTLIPHAFVASGYSRFVEDKSDRDQEILAERGTSVIHCPLVYSRGGTMMESFGRYKRLGVNLSMGTDTFPADMIMNIRMGSFAAQSKDENRPENHVANFYRAATLGGAKALGREDLGRLAPGAKADIIVIDLDHYHFGATDDPIRTMAYCGSGLDVKMTIVNGRVVMKDRKIPGIDLEELKRKGQDYYDRMKATYMERSSHRVAPEQIFKPSFPYAE